MSLHLTTVERPTNTVCPDCGRPVAANGAYRVVPRGSSLVRVCKAQAACRGRQELRRTDPELFAELFGDGAVPEEGS